MKRYPATTCMGFLLAVLAGGSGCSSGSPTVIDLTVSVDPALVVDTVDVAIRAPGKADSHVTQARKDPVLVSIFTRGLEGGTVVSLEASGIAAGMTVVLGRAKVTLISGRRLPVTIQLTAACAGVLSCDATQTCDSGVCVDIPTMGDGGIVGSGGLGGGSPADASSPDAADGETGMVVATGGAPQGSGGVGGATGIAGRSGGGGVGTSAGGGNGLGGSAGGGIGSGGNGLGGGGTGGGATGGAGTGGVGTGGVGTGGQGTGGVGTGGVGTGGMGTGGSGTGGNGKTPGTACGATSECQDSLTCLDGVCCRTSTCAACLNCGSTGTCNVVVKNAEDPSGMTCSGTHSCDATGTCNVKPCSTLSCGIQSACVTGSCSAARRVFISSITVAANFGGALAADGKCQVLAIAAGLGGTWMAWVSDSTTSPSARFTKVAVPYRLVDGTLIAMDWTTLTSGTLANGIDEDETGVTRAGNEVWTATNVDGTLLADGCTGFTSNDVAATNAEVGLSGRADAMWTSVYQQLCNRTNVRLYCVEQ